MSVGCLQFVFACMGCLQFVFAYRLENVIQSSHRSLIRTQLVSLRKLTHFQQSFNISINI